MSEESTDVARMIPLLRHALGDADLDLPSHVQTVFNAIMGSRPDFLVIVDIHGIVRFVSNACERFFGLPLSELEGQPFETLIAPQDRQLYSQFIDQRVEPLIGQSFSEPIPLDLRMFVRIRQRVLQFCDGWRCVSHHRTFCETPGQMGLCCCSV